MPVVFLDGYQDSDNMGHSDNMEQILAGKARFETASPEERRRKCAKCLQTFASRNQLFKHFATCGTIEPRKAALTTPGVLTISDHPHVLNYSQSLRHRVCDLCETDIKRPHDGYRCNDGCDFDVCMKCAKGCIGPRPAQSAERPAQSADVVVAASSSQLPYGSRVQVQSTCALNGKLCRILSVAPYTVREWKRESLSRHHIRHDAMGRVVVEDGIARMCAPATGGVFGAPQTGGFVCWRSLKSLFDASHRLAAVSTPDNEAALLKAAEKGDKGRVEELLKAGTNPDCCSPEVTKWTPLHWAANNGHEAVVALLVRYNADVNSVDSDRETPLKLAMRKGKSKVVVVLKNPSGLSNEDCMPRFDFETCWRDWKSSGFKCCASSTGRREATDFTYMCELVLDGKIQVSPIRASHLSLLPGKPSNSSLPDLAPERHREPGQQDEQDANALAGRGVKKDSPWQVGTLVRLLDETSDSDSHLAPGRGARSIGCIASVDLHHNKVSVCVSTDRCLSKCGDVKIGDKVRLFTRYAAVYDAVQGPMVPGQTASVKALQDGLVLVESVGEGGVKAKWWYEPAALVLASASISQEDSQNAVCFDSITDAGACNNGEFVCVCVCVCKCVCKCVCVF
jgi:hypothetical protein